MPRTARLDAPGVLHHIMIRGIEGRRIFLSTKDREDFLDRLAKLLPETKTACYTWVFMPNHAFSIAIQRGVDLDMIAERVSEVCKIEKA